MHSITIAHLSRSRYNPIPTSHLKKRNFLFDYVVRRFYEHSFLHRGILQVLNSLFLETHGQPSVVNLGMDTFLVKVNRGLVPLGGREHGSTGIRLVEQYLENRPFHTSAVLGSGQRSISWSSNGVDSVTLSWAIMASSLNNAFPMPLFLCSGLT